jgi:trans-aconitate methyltransferase
MCELVVRHAPGDRPIAVLDVGCGTGSLVVRLAEALPLASVVGIDISPVNIRAAEAERAARSCRDRVSFESIDYLQYETRPLDLIASDGVLHYIAGGAEGLWRKLARDLGPGGVIVACMAYDCAHNRITAVFRRMMRRLRSGALDRLLAAIGGLRYGHRLDTRLIQERTEYMYIPPEQLMTQAVIREIAPATGLRCIAHYDMPAASITQLRQRVIVFVKDRGAR